MRSWNNDISPKCRFCLYIFFLKEIVASPTYCKCGYFRLWKISRKYWQDLSRGVFAWGTFRENIGKTFHVGVFFHDATPFSLIKSLLSFYFRKGGISVKKAISRKLPPREISAFTVHMYAYIDLATPIMNSLKLQKKKSHSWTNFLCRLRSIVTHRDHFVRRPFVRPSVCLSVRLSHVTCHTFQSYVSQATHAFLGMLPLFFIISLLFGSH